MWPVGHLPTPCGECGSGHSGRGVWGWLIGIDDTEVTADVRVRMRVPACAASYGRFGRACIGNSVSVSPHLRLISAHLYMASSLLGVILGLSLCSTRRCASLSEDAAAQRCWCRWAAQ